MLSCTSNQSGSLCSYPVSVPEQGSAPLSRLILFVLQMFFHVTVYKRSRKNHNILRFGIVIDPLPLLPGKQGSVSTIRQFIHSSRYPLLLVLHLVP